MIVFTDTICGSLAGAMSREWLETNGIGGFASSTIIGMNTRRYHGLLVAANVPPVGRVVLLSKLEETLVIDGRRHELGTNQFPGAIHPQGYSLLREFRLDPFPVFTYVVDEVTLKKCVFMIDGENTAVVSYEASGAAGGEVTLEIRALAAFRDYHGLTHENAVFDATVRQSGGVARLQPYPELPTLYLAHDAKELDSKGAWYKNFEYEAERERGLDFQEDLYHALTLTFDLGRRPTAVVIASTVEHAASEAPEMRRRELERRAKTPLPAAGDEMTETLRGAAGRFLVRRGAFQTVIAGYHWFGDWGRDTMISLPGLTLYTGRPELARQLLLVFAEHVNQGLLPNRFTETGAAEYNAIDATLWYFEAVRAYVEHTGDLQFIRQNLYAVLRQIVSWHERGTLFGIRADADGLLEGGEEGSQLTWMDAKVGDFVVTPRRGKPVEVQALWYNALRVMRDLAAGFGDAQGQAHYAERSALAKQTFSRVFWNDNENCLYDVVRGDVRDGSIRPNQIFAVGLPHSMLDNAKCAAVLARVESNLLTPYGLRSLAPFDPRYRGRYESDLRSRDTAYHQGTVWPWLMGPYFRAYRRVHGDGPETRAVVQEWLRGFHGHLSEAGLGQVSEIFDGDPPHAPRGCIAQAWSVAELLRVAAEFQIQDEALSAKGD